MEYSVREAKANFSAAATAAANGERVVITKHGKPFVEIVPVRNGTIDWDALARIQKELGFDTPDYDWPDEFNDPAFSRRALGIDE